MSSRPPPGVLAGRGKANAVGPRGRRGGPSGRFSELGNGKLDLRNKELNGRSKEKLKTKKASLTASRTF